MEKYPNELSNNLIKKLKQAYTDTYSLKGAAGSVEISVDAVRRWMRIGRDYASDFQTDKLEAKLYLEIESAHAELQKERVRKIKQAYADKNKNFTADQWLLERRHREDFSNDSEIISDLTQQVNELKTMFDKLLADKQSNADK